MSLKYKFIEESLYVLGMAKSSLQFKTSGPRRNLELDVLRLIYFINLFEQKEIRVFGIILVHNDEIKNLIYNYWLPKYNFKNSDYFKVLTFDTEKDFLDKSQDIWAEKKNNSTFKNSKANLCQETTEKILTTQIQSEFGIENLFNIEISDFNGVKWDYLKKFSYKKL